MEFCWSRWQSKKPGNVLIVVDDVTDYEEIATSLPPQPSSFRVLITTRLNFEEIKSVSLDVLDEPDAIELLKQWVGEEKIEQQIEDVQELCWRLGYLPLALEDV